jgi:N-acetylmuramoyl-L-alanine amidase
MMKVVKSSLLSLLLIFLEAQGIVFCQSPDFTGYRLFINPGHGGNDSDDRHMLVADFWESEGNLTKGLFLREIMVNLKATVFMSRTTNTTADDLPLSSISAMANAANADFFLSIHSNGFDGSQNQPLMLFRGYDNQPVYPESKVIAGIIWDKIYEKGNCWTNSSKWVKGDWTFYPDWGTQGLGVLRGLTMPGVLSEGSFHDYIPESWRLRNPDFLHHESWAFVRALTEHENVTPVSKGLITGIVRDSLRSPSWYFKPGTKDKSLPLNNVHVRLIPGNKSYTVDSLNNGFFMFDSLSPGPYKLIFEGLEEFFKDSLEVNVNCNKTTIADICLKYDTTIVPVLLSVSPQTTDSVVFNQEFTIVFSLPMNRDSVHKALRMSPPVELSFAWDEKSTVLKFKPTVQYLSKTNYTATFLESSCSRWNVEIEAPYSFTFLTKNRTKLTLDKSFPTNGRNNISIYPQIRLMFDAPLNQSLLATGVRLTDAAGLPLSRIRELYLEKEGKGYYYFEPSEALPLNEPYKIILDQNLADIAGNTLGQTREISFTTRANPYPAGTLIESFDDISAFWDPETSGSTIGTDNPLTTFTSSTLMKISGTASGKLDYVFVNQDGGVCRTFNSDKPVIGEDASCEFGMWVFGDLSGNVLEYWFYSSGNINQIVPVDTIDWAGWELKTIPVSSIGGSDVRSFHSMVIRQTSGGEKSGTIWFDEARLFAPTSIHEQPDHRENLNFSVYPNPFSLSGKISFTLKERAEIRLDVLSLTGNTIESLAAGELIPGDYIYIWTPGPSVQSGMYIFRLSLRMKGITVPQVITRRCVLIR